MVRKMFRFTFLEPHYSHFTSAITGALLHGHPGDEVVVITPEEAGELRQELYAQLPPNPDMWTDEQRRHYGAFAGKKVVTPTEAKRHTTERMGAKRRKLVPLAEWFDAPEGFDLRDFIGLPPIEQPEEETENGD